MPNVEEFDKTIAILRTDRVFDEYLNKLMDYINVVYIKDVEELNPSDKK